MLRMEKYKKITQNNVNLFREIGQCFNDLANDENCRSIVLTGSGRLFTAGTTYLYTVIAQQVVNGIRFD